MEEKLNSAEKSHGANFLKNEKAVMKQFMISIGWTCSKCSNVKRISNDRLKCGLRSNQFDEWQPVYVKDCDFCSEYERSLL